MKNIRTAVSWLAIDLDTDTEKPVHVGGDPVRVTNAKARQYVAAASEVGVELLVTDADTVEGDPDEPADDTGGDLQVAGTDPTGVDGPAGAAVGGGAPVPTLDADADAAKAAELVGSTTTTPAKGKTNKSGSN